MLNKIVSGGQTGVDQAALRAAKELTIDHGGWCPKGGFDENKVSVLDKYAVQPTDSNNPDIRTVLNIKDSDGTLIIVPQFPLPPSINDGTILTIAEIKKQKKPYLIVDLSKPQTAKEILQWLLEQQISILNIAGPRESNSPGIHEKSYHFIKDCLLLSKQYTSSRINSRL